MFQLPLQSTLKLHLPEPRHWFRQSSWLWFSVQVQVLVEPLQEPSEQFTLMPSMSCDLDGINVNCSLGSCKGSTSTWTCTLNQSQLDCLNQCLGSGKCNFNVDCNGNWNIGGCSCSYDCKPKDHNVPDNSTTVVLLGAAIAGVELLRRHLM